jgi:hypothetical protein
VRRDQRTRASISPFLISLSLYSSSLTGSLEKPSGSKAPPGYFFFSGSFSMVRWCSAKAMATNSMTRMVGRVPHGTGLPRYVAWPPGTAAHSWAFTQLPRPRASGTKIPGCVRARVHNQEKSITHHMHATYVRDQVSITHHGEHGPAAVVDLGLLEPLEVLRNGGEAQGVEAEVTARRSRHTRFRTRSSVRCLLILFFFFSGLVDRFLPGGGAVEVSGAGLAGHPLGGIRRTSHHPYPRVSRRFESIVNLEAFPHLHIEDRKSKA